MLLFWGHQGGVIWTSKKELQEIILQLMLLVHFRTWGQQAVGEECIRGPAVKKDYEFGCGNVVDEEGHGSS